MAGGGREAPRARDVRHIVLLGAMGSGKTTVGQAVSRRLRWRLDDSDGWLEDAIATDGRSIAERFGLDLLHELESVHLRLAIGAERPSVVAAAASVVDDPRCLAALDTAHDLVVAWLDADPAVLASRVRAGSHRSTEAMRALDADDRQRREAEYARAADVVVDATRPPEELADLILARLTPA